MTTREQLHQLIDRLPEAEVPGILALLQDLAVGHDPVLRSMDEAEADDEPLTPDDVAAIDAARRDPRPGLTSTEVLRELGIDQP